MSLTVDDLNAVRAQWEEWTADSGYELSIEVKDGGQVMRIVNGMFLGARLQSSLYLLVEIHKRPCPPEPLGPTSHFGPSAQYLAWGSAPVFSERVPYDAGALRASVAVLSRAIAGHVEKVNDAEA